MILRGYSLEIFKSKCDASAQGIHCYMHLTDDISEVLPFLNSHLGGFVYTENPPSLTLKHYGKLLTFHPDKVAVNALKDQVEAEKIADWLFREINETWENRQNIEPSSSSARQPTLIEVLKLLPKTNCRKCGEPTCMVFAARTVEGARGSDDCPELTAGNRVKLTTYLAGFSFE